MGRYPSGWLLNKDQYFETGKVHPVCGNTYKMLHDTRLKDYFDFFGTYDRHYGLFEGCRSSFPFGKSKESPPAGKVGKPKDSAPAGKGASTGGCC
jgi:hypothetical protein